MCGTPWGPIPGRYNQHIPVDIADDGEHMGLDSENEEPSKEEIDDEINDQDFFKNEAKSYLSFSYNFLLREGTLKNVSKSAMQSLHPCLLK